MVLAVLDSIENEIKGFRFGDYIRLEQIFHLTQCLTREQALEELLSRLADQQLIDDPSSVFEALMKRELHVSTAVGQSFALPHARMPDWHDFVVAIGMQSQGVSWAGKGPCVKIIFLIIGPEDKQIEYLKLVSYIAELIRDEHACKIMLSSQTPKEIFKIIKSANT